MRIRLPQLSSSAKEWLLIIGFLLIVVVAWSAILTNSFGDEVEAVQPAAEIQMVESEVVAEPPLKSRKVKLCPPEGSSNVAKLIKTDHWCEHCLLESIPAFDKVKHEKFKLEDGGQIIVAWGKPGTRVRMVQFYKDAPQMVVTRFTLPNPVVPTPKPVIPKPVIPKPDPVKPVKFESLHLVVLEDHFTMNAGQSEIIRQFRLKPRGAPFADNFQTFSIHDKESSKVNAYMSNVDAGSGYPYWFIVAKDGDNVTIVKEGMLTSSAEVIDELRQVRRVGRQVIRTTIPPFSNN